jgi:cyanophycinase-like exopeptidase
MTVETKRIPGAGWLALLGGGEFSFGETADADQAWLDRAEAVGAVGFVPAASGSLEYGTHFADYLEETFERRVETIPIYRPRDARRGKNAERVAAAAHLYLGGGVPDHLLDAIVGTPSLEAMQHKLEGGGTVVAIAAAAQALGQVVRSLFGSNLLSGLAWLPGGAIDTNFEPAHDRRLRQLLTHPEVHWAVGIPSGSALLLGPDGEREVIDRVYALGDPEGEIEIWQQDED